MTFYPLERLMNLYDGYCRDFVVSGQPLLLVQDEGRCYILRNHCPHQQAPLSRASVAGGHIRCPLHGMSFSLLTGKTNDGCDASLQYLPVAYEGNQVGVSL